MINHPFLNIKNTSKTYIKTYIQNIKNIRLGLLFFGFCIQYIISNQLQNERLNQLRNSWLWVVYGFCLKGLRKYKEKTAVKRMSFKPAAF